VISYLLLQTKCCTSQPTKWTRPDSSRRFGFQQKSLHRYSIYAREPTQTTLRH